MHWEKATGSRSRSIHDCVTDVLILVFINSINSQWEQLRRELLIVPVSVMLFFIINPRAATWGFMMVERLEIMGT